MPASPDRRPPPPTLSELLGRDTKQQQQQPPAGAAAGGDGKPTPASSGGGPGRQAMMQAGSDAAATQRRPGADERRLALVDGSNVAHFGGAQAKLRNVLRVRDKLVEEGYDPIVVADAALRHQIDDPDGYERLVQTGSVQQAPAGTDADYFILSFAKELNASIVSNDQFRDRSRQFSEVRKNVVRFMIVQDEVVFERRTHKRKG